MLFEFAFFQKQNINITSFVTGLFYFIYLFFFFFQFNQEQFSVNENIVLKQVSLKSFCKISKQYKYWKLEWHFLTCKHGKKEYTNDEC